MTRQYLLMNRDLKKVVSSLEKAFPELALRKEARRFYQFYRRDTNRTDCRAIRVHADTISYRLVPLLIVRKYDLDIEDNTIWQILDKILPHLEVATFVPQGGLLSVQCASHWEYQYSLFARFRQNT